MDLSNLSSEELAAELKRREEAKQNDREAYKDLVKETVPKALFRLAAASEALTNAKTDTYKFFEDVLELKEKAYGIKEKQMSHTFSSDQGEITIGFRVNDGWDDTVNAGVAKVNKFISGLAKDEETSRLVGMVMSLLKKDSKGNLKSNRVLELQKLTKEFNSEEFSDGVDIISKAYKPVRSSWFIEAYITSESGEKTPIPLNISSVEFAAGYEFNLNKNEKDESGSH